MAPQHPLPELFDDAVTEILLRLPPDEPRCLFRASVVCKLWRHIVTDDAFLRRYRRFHRTPPLLGFFSIILGRGRLTPGFTLTTPSASPFPGPEFDCSPWITLDCRHGRVLLKKMKRGNFTVWDPITGDREELPEADASREYDNAAVLCAATGCDHRGSCHGAFLIVCLWNYKDGAEMRVRTRVYSSQVRSWGTSISVHLCDGEFVRPGSGALVGDDIYFILKMSSRIIKYSLVKHHLSVIEAPESYENGVVIAPTEGGLLRLAGARGSSLYLWSRKANAEGIEGWIQYRVIELRASFPVNNPVTINDMIGFVEGAHVILVNTLSGNFIIDLSSKQVR